MMPCVDFQERADTDSGKNAILEVRQMAKDYGCRPSDLITGDPFKLSLDLIVSQLGWDFDDQQYKKHVKKT